MSTAKRASLCKIAAAAGLFILAGFFRQAERTLPSLPSAACFLSTNLIHIALALAWGVSISRRILNKRVRGYLLLSCGMAVLWLLLRAMKYRYFGSDLVARHLWYLYYVPQTFAPLFSLMAALCLGRDENAPSGRAWRLMYIPATLLCAGILTNDLHQLAFRFSKNMLDWDSDYTHGPLYFIAMSWSIALLLIAVGIIYRKCRISESRSRAWIPLCAFIAGFALSFLSFANIYTFHKLPECICLTFAALWESCLQIGLLPTNDSYLSFFAESSVAAQITDRNALVLYRAKAAPQLTQAQMLAAQEGAIPLGADLRLQSAPVHGGRVYWVDSVARVNRIKEQLQEIHAQLSEENELVRAETELKRQRAQIDEKNRLYDHIATLLAPQLDRMDALLSHKEPDLKRLCVLGAYVKRRSNLALICDGRALVAADELTHCIRESLEYLTICGVACALHQVGEGKICASSVQAAYDFFEAAVEAALPTLSALMVRLDCREALSLRLIAEAAAGIPTAGDWANLGTLTVDMSDGAPCMTLVLPKEARE